MMHRSHSYSQSAGGWCGKIVEAGVGERGARAFFMRNLLSSEPRQSVEELSIKNHRIVRAGLQLTIRCRFLAG
jgi:hypothetical protein